MHFKPLIRIYFFSVKSTRGYQNGAVVEFAVVGVKNYITLCRPIAMGASEADVAAVAPKLWAFYKAHAAPALQQFAKVMDITPSTPTPPRAFGESFKVAVQQERVSIAATPPAQVSAASPKRGHRAAWGCLLSACFGQRAATQI